MTVQTRSRGYLAHLESQSPIYFVTFRLADSLPRELLVQLHAERQTIEAVPDVRGLVLGDHNGAQPRQTEPRQFSRTHRPGGRDCRLVSLLITEKKQAVHSGVPARRAGERPRNPVGLPDLRNHKKTDLGQARDRRTLREFQFPEYIIPVIRASACPTETRHAARGPHRARHRMAAVRGTAENISSL